MSYDGPYYFHQPGHNRHNESVTFLRNNTGAGVVFSYEALLKSGKGSSATFQKVITDYHSLKVEARFLLDTGRDTPESLIDDDSPIVDAASNLLDDRVQQYQYIGDSLKIQQDARCTDFIIPNMQTKTVSDDWYTRLYQLCTTTYQWLDENGTSPRPVYLNVSFPADYIYDSGHCQELLDQLARLDVDGFYLNIVGIPQPLTDSALIKSLMEITLQLKMQDKKIIFSKAGRWFKLLFPLGLDVFANDGFKSMQTVPDKRSPDAKGGFKSAGGPQPYDVWSPSLMDNIRFPEEAEQLDSILSMREKKKLYGEHTGYAPPLNVKPDTLVSKKGYKRNRRLNHFVMSMAQEASAYQSLASLNERISRVERDIKEALEQYRLIERLRKSPENVQEKQVWLDTLSEFVDENSEDLEFLYG